MNEELERHLRIIISSVIRDELVLEKLQGVSLGGFRRIGGGGSRRSGGFRGDEEPGEELSGEVGDLGYEPSGKAGGTRGVRMNRKLSNAWAWLSPLLPDGARLTSGVRDQAHQDRIIKDFARRKLGTNPQTEAELTAAHSALKKKGYIIARKIGRGHGSGEAFDISGASLYKIKSAVVTVSNDPDIPVTFSDFCCKGCCPNRSIVEKVNGAVHVGVMRAAPADPQRIAQITSKYRKGSVA